MRRLLVIAALAGTAASFSAGAFDTFEHRFLGNRAYDRALKPYQDTRFGHELQAVGSNVLGFGQNPEVIARVETRLAGRVPLGFGDLPALAGDYTASRGELFQTILLIRRQLDERKDDPTVYAAFQRLIAQAEAIFRGTRRQWLSACVWIYGARKVPPLPPKQQDAQCFDHLDLVPDEKVRDFRFGSIGYRPDRAEQAEQEGIPGYVELAARNRSHFPRHSWKAYADNHRAALRYAACYRDRGKVRCDDEGRPIAGPEGKGFEPEELLAMMLVAEGFAQHFLQDSFAAGHIASKFGGCSYEGDTVQLLCRPTKARVQQTHDVLNQLGLSVALLDAQGDRAKHAARPWTAFGDRHLFTPEADLHRAIILDTAEASLAEVFKRAAGGDKRAAEACDLCTTGVFPVEAGSVEKPAAIDEGYEARDLAEFELLDSRLPVSLSDERSKDPRVPILPVEGWKLGVAIAQQNSGDERVGSNGGMMLRMDYMRNVGSGTNIYGVEYWNFLDRGSSLLGTIGWARPREVSLTQYAFKFKAGLRSEEANLDTGIEHRNGVELAAGLDFNYEIYRPLAIIVHLQPLALFHYSGQNRWETIFNGGWKAAVGVRFDFSGI
jgi:hypothetical protein